MKFELAGALVAAALAFAPLAAHAAERAPIEKANEIVTDASISAKVKGQLTKLPSASSIFVESKQGVVTLSGNVNTKAEADAAATIAKGGSGVTKVQNNLRVLGK